MKTRLGWVIALAALLIPVGAFSQTESKAAPSLTAEAQVCTGIQERMPTGMAETFAPEVGQVYLWCKIIGCSGEETIKHVWYHNGNEAATVDLVVKSSGWRTWSAKKILPEMTGDWSVKIVDAQGNTVKEIAFKVAPK